MISAWAFGAAFVIGAGVGSWLTDNALSTEHEQFKATVAKDAQDRSLAVLMALQAAGERVKAGEATISKQREENAKADVELDRLNRCLKSGTCGLRVAAKCPGVPNPASGDGASGDIATGARLDALAGWRYLDFKRGYAEQLKTLRLCRVYGQAQSQVLAP